MFQTHKDNQWPSARRLQTLRVQPSSSWWCHRVVELLSGDASSSRVVQSQHGWHSTAPRQHVYTSGTSGYVGDV